MSVNKYLKTKLPKIPSNISEEAARKTLNHPCYSWEAHEYARIHLPVAPKCNIKCNYCNRKFDCINESRPGVSSEILKPFEALKRYKEMKEKVNKLSVVGIAGPGDALADFENTRATLSMIKEYDSKVTFCISTNGLRLAEYADELFFLGVSHITVTINAIDPEIGAQVYDYVMTKDGKLTGVDGAKYLLEKQLEGLEKASSLGMLVKINTVAIKEVNNDHIPEVIKEASRKGACLSNIVPLIPVECTKFEDMTPIIQDELNIIRKECGNYLTQMYHCKQCRADAVGRLGESCSHSHKGHAGECNKKQIS